MASSKNGGSSKSGTGSSTADDDFQELKALTPSPVHQYEPMKVDLNVVQWYTDNQPFWDQGPSLVWRDLSVFVVLKGNKLKQLINNVRGAVKPGTLIALMGASGAGKSTLMSALAYRAPTGTIVEGEMVVNNRRIGDFMHRSSGFMHQHELFIEQLTVQEHLNIMAKLRFDRRTSNILRRRRINIIMRQLGLYRSRHTRIGNGGGPCKLLSGGERKRLAFATELLTDPSLLFCDEPTTGLDSFSAQKLVSQMKSMAAQGKTIVCTIHQPSSEVFEMFDRLILLAEGRIAFSGTASDALEFFERQGYRCPLTYNPADFFIKILALTPGSESASKQAIKSICDQYAVSEAAKETDVDIQYGLHMMEQSIDERQRDNREDFKEPFFITKLIWLIYRNFLMVIRNPHVQMYKIIQKLAIATTAALCYVGAIQLTQMGVQAVQGCLFIIIAENTFSPMYAVLGLFPDEFPLFQRDITAGHYNTFLYYTAKIVSLGPGLIVEPVLFTLVMYWIAGLKATFSAFFWTLFLATLVLNVAIACGAFFSCAFGSMPIAIAYLVPFDYSLMITSGIFIKLSSIPIFIAWIRYFSWLMYSNEAMSIVQWEGVTNISCQSTNPDLPCLKTGSQVLRQYDFHEDNFWPDILCLVALYCLFHVLAFICLRRRARRK